MWSPKISVLQNYLHRIWHLSNIQFEFLQISLQLQSNNVSKCGVYSRLNILSAILAATFHFAATKRFQSAANIKSYLLVSRETRSIFFRKSWFDIFPGTPDRHMTEWTLLNPITVTKLRCIIKLTPFSRICHDFTVVRR